jgi:hypothetical protein
VVSRFAAVSTFVVPGGVNKIFHENPNADPLVPLSN